MIKVVSLIRKHPDLTTAQFEAYWREVHAPLVRERLPHMIHYCAGFPLPGAHGPVQVGALDYDAVVEIGFADRATMEADMTSPAFLADDRAASSARFMDMAASRGMVVEVVDAP
ncbi:EthD domain-containing protein [Novosphingobium bradum]|uniref:EthD domain-containing protein n=1 Tax=Novosphingobium bradum TaxID=1737444 RepID=A0ABV7IR21_9SPHN